MSHRRSPIVDMLGDKEDRNAGGLEDQGLAIAEAVRENNAGDAFDAFDRIGEELSLYGKPPGLLDAINVMRCQFCGLRPDLTTHAKCGKFLAEICERDDICQDVCHKYEDALVVDCCDSQDSHREKHCQTYKDLTAQEVQCAPEEEPDSDGDGHPDSEDAFPHDEERWKDSDGDGVDDQADAFPHNKRAWKDSDGDEVRDEADAFPHNKREWKDSDEDGIGDNSDPDRDGDHHDNEVDHFPDDHLRWEGGDHLEDDTDHDGHADKSDAFPHDPDEWADLDTDGMGDHSDDDIDGDGHLNENDEHPRDPALPGDDREKEWADLDEDGKADNHDEDIDGDGHLNVDDEHPRDPKLPGKDKQKKKVHPKEDRDGDKHLNRYDAFPDDKDEYLDSDRDGHGDKADKFPKNPDCYTDTLPCDDPEDSDGDGYNNDVDAYPFDSLKWEGRDTKGDGYPSSRYNDDWHKPSMKYAIDPVDLTKDTDKWPHGLPHQGFNEHSGPSKRFHHGTYVKHEQGKTYTGDWVSEWPTSSLPESTTIDTICEEHPENTWCDQFKKSRKFAR